MYLGKIVGKTSTKDFRFKLDEKAEKFQYIQFTQNNTPVLAQIIEIEKDPEKTIAICQTLGYRDHNTRLQILKTPPEPNTEIFNADDSTIREILGLNDKKAAAYIGKLTNYPNIKVYLNLNNLLTKHLAVLAKSGSGKSFCTAVLIEELLDKKIPVVIIDPHGEYSSLKHAAENSPELEKFDIKPKSYAQEIKEYSPDVTTNPEAEPLKLSNQNMTSKELLHLLPTKLSNNQKGTLYASLKNIQNLNFDNIISELEILDDSYSRYTIIHVIEYLKKLNIFSENSTPLSELVQQNRCSIINLKGISSELQEVIVYKIAKDLFQARKTNNIPPFFLVIEEAHNYVPERSFGESKSSPILRQLCAEGRKFGLGTCFITQRPSRIEKNILSQITTQIILKITNPHDYKAVSSSVEGITSEIEKEIRNIPIGTAIITGLLDLPIFVEIRPRKTKHGGTAVKIFEDRNFDGELLPVIKPTKTIKQLKEDNPDKEFKAKLMPCIKLTCTSNGTEFNLLLNLFNAEVVTDLNTGSGIKLKSNSNGAKLSSAQERVLQIAMQLKEFVPADLFSRSGLQFSELYDIVKTLETRGYFTKNGQKYLVHQSLSQDFNKYKTTCQINYETFKYDEKLQQQYLKKELLDYLAQFLQITNQCDCYLITYN